MKEWWKILWDRKGGAHEDRRNTLICFVIIVLLFIVIFWLIPRKVNYSKLHGRVSSLERIIEITNDRIKKLEAHDVK